jgi:hypothetical protein
VQLYGFDAYVLVVCRARFLVKGRRRSGMTSKVMPEDTVPDPPCLSRHVPSSRRASSTFESLTSKSTAAQEKLQCDSFVLDANGRRIDTRLVSEAVVLRFASPALESAFAVDELKRQKKRRPLWLSVPTASAAVVGAAAAVLDGVDDAVVQLACLGVYVVVTALAAVPTRNSRCMVLQQRAWCAGSTAAVRTKRVRLKHVRRGFFARSTYVYTSLALQVLACLNSRSIDLCALAAGVLAVWHAAMIPVTWRVAVAVPAVQAPLALALFHWRMRASHAHQHDMGE